MSPRSAQTPPNDVQPPPAVMQVLAEEAAGDNRFFRWSMGLAVAVHLVFFVTNWGFLAFADDGPQEEKKNDRLYIIQQVKFEVPPKVEQAEVVTPRKRIPIPDPTPDDPEPIRPPEPVKADVPVPDAPEFKFPEPPPVEEADPGPVIAGVHVEAPVRVSGPDPIYPKSAAAAGIGGVVVLECIIGPDGRVQSITPLRQLGFGLTESAVAAVERWVFEPSTLNGRPVAVQYNLTVNFNTNR